MACGNYKEYCESEFYRPDYVESVLSDEERAERETARVLTKCTWISALVFLVCVAGGSLLGVLNEKYLESSAKNRALAYEADTKEHEQGEEFPLQGLMLTVGEAWTLMEAGDFGAEFEEGLELPAGTKLVAVKIAGRSGDSAAGQSRLSDLYIQYEGAYYCQLSSWELETLAESLGIPVIEERSFEDHEGGALECWAAFVVEEKAQSFVLCLEERSGTYLDRIESIHQVPLRLEGGW